MPRLKAGAFAYVAPNAKSLAGDTALGGWRDSDGRTAAERKQVRGAQDRAHFASDVRRRPLALLKGLAGFALVLVLVFALVGLLR